MYTHCNQFISPCHSNIIHAHRSILLATGFGLQKAVLGAHSSDSALSHGLSQFIRCNIILVILWYCCIDSYVYLFINTLEELLSLSVLLAFVSICLAFFFFSLGLQIENGVYLIFCSCYFFSAHAVTLSARAQICHGKLYIAQSHVDFCALSCRVPSLFSLESSILH